MLKKASGGLADLVYVAFDFGKLQAFLYQVDKSTSPDLGTSYVALVQRAFIQECELCMRET